MNYYFDTTPSGNTVYFYELNGFKISFIADPDNTDYQAYLKWVSEGNTPLPAENT